MSHYDYQKSAVIALHDFPFYALIMAAIRQADSDNQIKLERAFPETYQEFMQRYHAPGGYLDGEQPEL